jgi:hypothetical protein
VDRRIRADRAAHEILKSRPEPRRDRAPFSTPGFCPMILSPPLLATRRMAVIRTDDPARSLAGWERSSASGLGSAGRKRTAGGPCLPATSRPSARSQLPLFTQRLSTTPRILPWLLTGVRNLLNLPSVAVHVLAPQFNRRSGSLDRGGGIPGSPARSTRECSGSGRGAFRA